MRNKILLTAVIGLIISMQFIASQLSGSENLTFLVSTDRETYLPNETVRIRITAPENTTTNLTIQDPDSYLYTTLGENLGSFTHLYYPELIGNYSAFANFYLLNESANASTSFKVIPAENISENETVTENITISLENTTLKTDKSLYLPNETVCIQITAPKNTTTNLTIQDPDGYLYSTLGENLGSFTHFYYPELIGNYSVSAKLYLLNASKNITISFEVIDLPKNETISENETSELMKNLELATLKTDKETYLPNETVRIIINVLENTTTNLTIRDPDGYLYTTLGENLGSFTHLYHPELTGNYSISAILSLLDETKNLTTKFEVIPTNVTNETEVQENISTESILKTASLSTDRSLYYLNETVKIKITAPENTTTNLTIKDPDGYLYATLGVGLGSFTHLYTPELTGNYSISAILSLLNETRNLTTEFKVIQENISEINITAISVSLKAKKKHFKAEEKPEFIFEYVTEKTKSEKALKLTTENETIKTSVYYKGQLTDIEPEIEKLREGKFSIELPMKRAFRAGIYKLEVQLTKNGETYTQEQEFPWGLVSLNTKKSIYKPGEPAEFIMVVLDRDGHSVCNANIYLTVTNPDNEKTIYSTGEGTVTTGSECGLYNANYPTEIEGNHTINIAAIISGIEVNFSTHFLVQQNYEFDIIRTAQSKIDPTKQEWFDVRIDIESFTDTETLTIKEFVPVEFDIISDADIEVKGDTKILTWNKNLIKDKTSATYTYSVPRVWPYLYALGPAEINYRETFTEARPWYVAVDPTNKLYESSTSNFTDTTAVIDLLSSRDGTANKVDFLLASSTLYNFVNATSNAMVGDIKIMNGSTVNFSAYFSCGDRVDAAYLTWKFYKLSGSTETLICQKGDDSTNGVQLPDGGTANLTGNCSPTSDVTLNSTDKLKLILNINATSIGGGSDTNKHAVHYWDSAYESWVQYEYIVPPKTNETHVNVTAVEVNNTICVNHTVTKGTYSIDKTWVEITYPNGTSMNITTSNSTGVCGAGGNIYGAEIDVGSITGTFTVNTSWVNDTQGNYDYDDPKPLLNVNVVSPAPSNVIVKTYRDSSYSETDKFFTRNDVIYIEANVTNAAGNITDANVTADILNSTNDVVDTVNLTHVGGGSSLYQGNWTSGSSDALGVYIVNFNATNPYGSKTGDSEFHLYSGENVSAYHMDYSDDGVNESVMENKHLIVVFNETDNTDKLILYLEQKDTNISYTFGSVSDPDSIGKGEVTTSNMESIRIHNFSFSQEGENLTSVDLGMKANVIDPPRDPAETAVVDMVGGVFKDMGVDVKPSSSDQDIDMNKVIVDTELFEGDGISVGTGRKPIKQKANITNLNEKDVNLTLNLKSVVNASVVWWNFTQYDITEEPLYLRAFNRTMTFEEYGFENLTHTYLTGTWIDFDKGRFSWYDVSNLPHTVKVYELNGKTIIDLEINISVKALASYIIDPFYELSEGNYSIRYDGEVGGDNLGVSVAVGDVNGDNLTDLIMGAWTANFGGGGESGSVYVVYSNSTKPDGNYELTAGNYNIRYNGPGDQDRLGCSVAVGDVNGDNITDLIMGAYRSKPDTELYAGSVYVVYSNSTRPDGNYNLTSGNYNIRYDGPYIIAYLGFSVAVGDVNGDNLTDLIMGAWYTDPVKEDEGSVYVVYSNSTRPDGNYDMISGNYNIRYDGDAAGGWLGYSVAVGDVNGDNITDLIMGAPKAGFGVETETGSVYVVYSNSTRPDGNYQLSASGNYNIRYDGNADYDYLGYPVAVGDVNGDNLTDLVMGAHGADFGGGGESGSVYVVYSNSTRPDGDYEVTSGNYNIRYDGDAGGDELGRSVAVGDVNGDNLTDLIMGADLADFGGGDNSGSVYIVYSNSTRPDGNYDMISGNYNIRYDGDAGGDNLGYSVAVGDFDGDNLRDLIMGAYTADFGGGGGSGSVYTIEREIETSFNITIQMRTEDVDYLLYRLYNFDSNIDNINDIWSDIAGTLGSSVADDRYHLENGADGLGTDGLITSLTKDQWNSYTDSNYSLIYDNSISSDTVNDNVIAWVRFNETANVTFQDIGLWNSSSEGFRMRYDTSLITAADEVNYILAFTKGRWSTIHKWMPTIEGGNFPTVNFMTPPPLAPSTVTVVKTYRNSSYSDTDKFFDRQQVIYVEANVTDFCGDPMTNVTVKANFTINSNVEKTIDLTHYSWTSYRGNWTTNSTQTVGVYNITVYANNSYGNATGSNLMHLYSGENVSAYHMDYNEDGVNESIMENKHLIVVFNETDNTDKLILYLEQKDTNISYTFGSIFDPDSIGKGEVTTTDMKEIKVYNFAFSSEGENISSVDLDAEVNVTQLSGWNSSYRRAINISNTAGNQTNYQVLVNLTSSNFNFSKANSDGNDTRFTYYNSTSQTETEIPYWIESWNSTAETAEIWVNVTYLEDNTNTTIYMYYGNPSAKSKSNGTNTFELFDDFSDNNISDWSTNEWGDYNGDIIADNYQMRLRVYKCYNVEAYKNLSTSYPSNTTLAFKFYWRTQANNGYEYPGWKVLVNGSEVSKTVISGTDIQNPNNAGTVESNATVNDTTTLLYRIYQSGECNWGSHIDTHLWIDTIRVRKYALPEPSAIVGAEEEETPPEITASLNLTVRMRTEDVDYLIYKLNDFDSNIQNISDIWSDIAGTLGSSVADDCYHLENGTDGLITDLTKDRWNNYTTQSNYSLIYDNSTSGDSVNDNVIAWVRFNETTNITFQDVGLWNSSSEGFRIRYNTSSATETDEVNYILAFTKGDYSTIDQWMPTVEGGNFPTVNFMTAPSEENVSFSIFLNSPLNQTTTNDSTPDFNFTVNGSKSTYSCELFLNDTSYGTNSSTQNDTPTVITANPPLSDGTYNWYINCTAGSVTNQSEIREITIDTPPDITIVNPQNNTNLSAGTTWTWINISTDENAVCRYNLTNSTFDYSDGINFTNTGGQNHSFNYSGLQDGQTYTLYYKCNDSAGNINPTSVMHVFSVKSTWHRFYGHVTGNMTLEGAVNETLYKWNVVNVSGNVYVADADSTITWTELYALGKMSNGSNGTTDFKDADTALGINAADNISVVYTDDGGNTARNTTTFNVFKSVVEYVPIDESTNNTNFWTGILWDSSDSTDNEFNATEQEDIVFLVEINENAQGKYDVCDYEIKIPYKLQEYKDSTDMLYFYLELG